MTRDEAHKLWHKDSWQLAGRDYHRFIDIVYDELESRTCESCRWYKEIYNERSCASQNIHVCALWDIAFAPDMGCNKWEAKNG